MKSSQVLALLAGIVAIGDCCVAEDTKTQSLLTQSDPLVQQRIGDLIDALKAERSLEAVRRAEALRRAVEDDDDLVRQVAVFVATTDYWSEPAIGCVVVYRILDRLEVQPKAVIRTFAEYLDSENELLRGFVRDWFRGFGPPGDPLDDEYKDYLIDNLCRGQEVPSEFIELLFEESPGRALLVFNRVAHSGNAMDQLVELRRRHNQEIAARRERGEDVPLLPAVDDLPCPRMPRLSFDEIRAIRLAERLVSHTIWLKENRFEGRHLEAAAVDARGQLAMLSEHEAWWARRYAVEIMRRHRDLRLPESLSKLRQDSDLLVREAAMAATD
ncbi:MAG: hypothetical protein RIC11_03930 [Botrimarina sp.]